MQRTAPWGAALVAAAALVAPPAAAQDPGDAAHRVAVAGGSAPARDVNLVRVAVASAWRPREGPRLGPWHGPLWELNVTRWDPHGNDSRPARYSIGARASLRLPLEPAARTFLEAGTGPLWIDESRLLEAFDIGGEIHFNTHVGIGRVLGAARTHELAASVHHVSNADLESINPGIDFALLEYSVLF